MKVVILAGGYGTRLSEETGVKPKPMVEVGERPILWHIMKIYSAYDIHEFIVCCGYKGRVIKEYFANYHLYRSDVTFDMDNGSMALHRNGCEPWKVTLVDTGDGTMTGGRLKRVREHIGDETFCFTYGDGVADVDIPALLQFHRQQERLATVTAVQPSGRFGTFKLDQGQTTINQFREKSPDEDTWINGGFYVLEPEAIDYIEDDDTVWERGPMEGLACDDQLAAFRHHGFWQPMDTLRDKNVLEDLWQNEKPWKVW